MSTTLYVALDREISGLDPNDQDRGLLAKLSGDPDSMDTLAKRLGIRSICEFQSYAGNDMADLIDDVNDPQVASILAAKPDWFDPAAAIPALQALQVHFASARYISPRAQRVDGEWEDIDDTNDLLDELKSTEAVLAAAAGHGVRFRFHVGF